MPGLEQKILEELIYEKVRLSLDMCALLEFEADLAASIERALAQCARSPAERSDLAMSYLTTAWERLGDEVMTELAEAELGSEPRDEQGGRSTEREA